MPIAPSKACTDCGKGHLNRGTRCDDCAAKNADAAGQYNRFRMKDDPIWKFYQCATWVNFRKTMRANGNVYCQAIEDGRRCRRPATVGHHLISPREDRTLVYNHNNVVMVCAHHHPRTAGDTPDHEYVPTLMGLPGQGIKIPAWYPQPDDIVTADCPRWHCKNVYDRVNKRPPAKPASVAAHGHTSNVGDAALDAALGDVAELLKGI
jgi:hypothetical protein